MTPVEVERTIHEMARRIVELFHPEKIILFGSHARGEAGPDSDLDVLLIVRDKAAGRKRQMREIGYMLDPYGEVIPSIMAYTETEWEDRRKSGSRFRKSVERDKVRVL